MCGICTLNIFINSTNNRDSGTEVNKDTIKELLENIITCSKILQINNTNNTERILPDTLIQIGTWQNKENME